MQKAESRLDRGFSRVFGRSSKVSLQADELAANLLKEMDGRKRVVHGHQYVPNFYVAYLCPADRARFQSTEEALIRRLESQLLRHAQSMGCDVMSAPEVSIFTDKDLRQGQFGLRAEIRDPVSGRVLDSSAPVPGLSAAPVLIPEEQAVPARSVKTPGPAYQEAPAPRETVATPDVPVLRPRETGLSAVVLRQNGRSQEFRKERVVLGRARDADLRVQDPNVSRRHAMIYRDQGKVLIKDLGSTNGTLLNGRPVSTSALKGGDIVTLGGTHVVVEMED